MTEKDKPKLFTLVTRPDELTPSQLKRIKEDGFFRLRLKIAESHETLSFPGPIVFDDCRVISQETMPDGTLQVEIEMPDATPEKFKKVFIEMRFKG